MPNHFMKNQKGQALPFVIVSMTVLMAVLVNLSLRQISSDVRTTTTDTSLRISASADGIIEKFLSYPYRGSGNENLEALRGICTDAVLDPALSPADVPDECKIVYEDNVGEDVVSTVAIASVDYYGNEDTITKAMQKDKVQEINLDGFSGDHVTLCWNGADTNLYTILYGDGELSKALLCPGSCGSDVEGGTDGLSVSGDCDGYDYEYDLDTSSADWFGLRLRTTESSQVKVFSPSDDFPVQGYEITAKALILDEAIAAYGGDSVREVITKKARKSYPFLPEIFDFGIYAQNGF